MKKLVSTILGTCLALTILTGCGGTTTPKKAAETPKAKTETVYKVGMDATYAPFGFQDKDKKEYIGFDVDIIKAIAKAEGFKVDIQNIAFDGLIPALQTGNLDIVINDMTITEDRAKTVLFSKPYYIAGQGLLVNKNNNSIKLKKDLDGKKVGVSIPRLSKKYGINPIFPSKRIDQTIPIAAIEQITGKKKIERAALLNKFVLLTALAISRPIIIWSGTSKTTKTTVFFSAFQNRSS